MRSRILLTDDEPLVTRPMARYLRHAGWEVDAVNDGASALALAKMQGHEIIVLDLEMPGLDGLTVLDAIRKQPHPPAIIMISGFLDVQRTLRALDSGAVEVLEKPVELRHLLQILENIDGARLATPSHSPEFIGGSPAARLIREQIETAARFRDLPVMVVGETGTGKEVVAQAIHRISGQGPMVSANCAAIPDELFESELFGHSAGAFSGANGPREGLFESAGAGTLFLDEVGEMPASQQAKLLRALETRKLRRVGSNHEIPIRARVVSATNQFLTGRSGETMRSDLYFRLAGYAIRTPPLRERTEDIEALALHFLKTFDSRPADGNAQRASDQRESSVLSPGAIEALRAHHWPGNVRELRSVVQLAAVNAASPMVGVRHVVEALRARGCLASGSPLSRPSSTSGVRIAVGPDLAVTRPMSSAPPSPRASGVFDRLSSVLVAEQDDSADPCGLPDLERSYILRVFAESGGNVAKTARILAIPRSTLRDKLARYRERQSSADLLGGDKTGP